MENLLKATTKEKIFFLLEHNGELSFNNKRLITPKEREKIIESINRNKDIKLYEKYKDYEKKIINALASLESSVWYLKTHSSELRGFFLVWQTLETAELTANIILKEIKNPEREKITNKIIKNISFVFSEVTKDSENFIKIQTDQDKEKYKLNNKGEFIPTYNTENEELLKYIIQKRNDLISSAVVFISYRDAILNYMKKVNFNIKSYKNKITKYNNSVFSPIIGIEKYLEKPINKNSLLSKKRIDILKENYSFAPDLKELKANKEKIINFQNYFFYGE